MTVVELVDGKTLETVFRTKNFLLKMLIRRAVLELRSLGSNEVWKCVAYLVAS
jgi:hypothetical protein